jgi:Fe-S-cluster-containing hydrogenase component 2
MSAVVDKELCTGCETCVGECPVEAIEMIDGKAHINDSCVDCGACVEVCPVEAITMQ